MSYQTPKEDGFTALYDGAPVIVRLITGEEILTVAYHSTDDDRMMLERPIAVQYESLEQTSDMQDDLNVSRVRTRFERWLSMSDALMFPVYLDHVLTIAPLADNIVQAYVEWAEKLYDHGVVFRELQQVGHDSSHSFSEQLPPDTTVDEVRKSYFDYVLQNFKPKGKPN